MKVHNFADFSWFVSWRRGNEWVDERNISGVGTVAGEMGGGRL